VTAAQVTARRERLAGLALGTLIVASLAVLVSGSIVALVLATTWVPTRKVLGVALSEALRSE